MEVLLPEDFKEFLKLLNATEVDYLLVGGFAVGFYGYPRATTDIDIWIAVNQVNADRMVSVLKEFGFDTPDLNASVFLKKPNILRMGNPPLRIEVMTSISGVAFDECYKERVVGQMDGIQVSVISLHMLKKNKLASGRFKDLDDLEHLA